MSQYIINIENDAIHLDANDLSELDIMPTASDHFHLLQDGKAFTIEILHTDFAKKALTLKVNGTRFDLKIEDAFDQLTKRMGLFNNASQKAKNVKAPMPGLILDILVKPGQEINEGEQLVILEAMKMENVLHAEGEGTVKSIEVKKGASVDKGQVLIEME